MSHTEFQSKTYTTDDQNYRSVVDLSDGGFVVTWHSEDQDGDGYDTYGQCYDLLALGRPIGSEFQIKINTTGEQYCSSITTLIDLGLKK